MPDPGQQEVQFRQGSDDFHAPIRVRLHQGVFVLAQRGRLLQHALGDPDLADVVQDRRQVDDLAFGVLEIEVLRGRVRVGRHALAMTSGVGVLGLDGLHERPGGLQPQGLHFRMEARVLQGDKHVRHHCDDEHQVLGAEPCPAAQGPAAGRAVECNEPHELVAQREPNAYQAVLRGVLRNGSGGPRVGKGQRAALTEVVIGQRVLEVAFLRRCRRGRRTVGRRQVQVAFTVLQIEVAPRRADGAGH